MLKILLVEDSQDKIREILKTIVGVDGITDNQVDVAHTVHDAKVALTKTRYGLLILDMHLPIKNVTLPVHNAGLRILTAIDQRKVLQPKYVVGMTEYDESLELAQASFRTFLRTLIKFSFTNVAWRTALEESLKYLVAQDSPPYSNDGSTYHVDVGIVCALQEELDVLLTIMEAGWKLVTIPHEQVMYYEGNIQINKVTISLVAVATPEMGMPGAAVAATKMIYTFRPRLLVMAGLCAGVRDKTDYGDILIANPCFNLGSGKWVGNKDEDTLDFHSAQYQMRLVAGVRTIITSSLGCKKWMQSIYRKYTAEKPQKPPKIMMDAMASGGSVIQSATMMKSIRIQHKNLIGLEMESYAVFAAAEYVSEPRPHCISIKSVCDFGDEEKCDKYRSYACYTSVQYLVKFAHDYYSNNPEEAIRTTNNV